MQDFRYQIFMSESEKPKRTFQDLIMSSGEFAAFVKEHQADYNAEDLRTLKSMQASWTFLSADSGGDYVLMKNSANYKYWYNIRTHEFALVVDSESGMLEQLKSRKKS